MASQEEYERARKRAEAKLGFYIHLIVYVIVGTLLAIINLTTTSDSLWVQWPLIGWAIGILFHALSVFVFHDRPSVTDQMIERELLKGV